MSLPMTKEINRDTLLDLLAKPAQYEYFFKNLDKPNWFDYLLKLNVFHEIPSPRLIDDGQYIQFPPWWPGKYLIKIADRIPEKVLSVIEKVKTENGSAIDDCSRAIVNMPDKFIAVYHNKIVALYDKWINTKYAATVKYDVDNIFNKLIRCGCFEGALKLLDILSKVKKEKDTIKLRYEIYYYKEILKKYQSKLAEYNPILLLTIIEAKLKDAIKLETESEQEGDHSIVWRPFIEDSPQNYDFDEPKDIFVDILRDVLYSTLLNKPDDAKKVVEKYLKDAYSIFRRLAIHIIRLSNFDDLIKNLLTDESNLSKSEIDHEFFKLVEDKFGVLNSNQKKQFIKSMIAISMKEIARQRLVDKGAEKYKAWWLVPRLRAIKNYLEKDEDVKEFRYLLDSYNSQFAQTDKSYVSTSWVGPTSALTKEEIAKKSPEEFIEWIKHNLQPPYDIESPSAEGVSRIFQEVVKENPYPYAKDAEKFIDEKILPAYLSGLLYGLSGAISDNKVFELEPVLKLIESPLKFHSELKGDSYGYHRFDIGQYSWVRGVIATFIESLVANNDFKLTEDLLKRTQSILTELIEKDEEPTEKNEKEYGKEAKNMDYVTYCINSNRGKAMCALMQHALRRAKMRPDEEKKKEEGKGPFPPGERMNEYKEFLTKRLDDEKSPSVQSSYGRFLPYLCYLDQDWIKDMISSGKLFPKIKERQRFWEAHWEGYIGFTDMRGQLYNWLKKDYEKAVDDLINDADKKEKHERYDDRLADHLMIAYWRGLEDMNTGGILDKFFKNVPVSIRGHAIWFLGTAIDKIKPNVVSDEWKRLRKLWDYRLKNCEDDEIGNFVKWLKNCPEKLDDIAYLIKPSIPFLAKHYSEDDFFDYLLLKVEESPIICLGLLDQLLSIRERIFLQENKINDILIKASAFKTDPPVAQEINKVINTLGIIGYYEFRKMLV